MRGAEGSGVTAPVRVPARRTSPPGCAARPSPPGSGSGSASAFAICFLTGLISHYAQNPSQPVPFPTQPVLGLPGDPGTARDRRLRLRPAAAGEALVGVPAAVRPAAQRSTRCSRCTRLERGSIAVLVGRGDLPARHRPGQRGAVVPVDRSPSGPPTTRSPGWRSVRWLVHIAVKLPVIRGALGADVDDTSRRPPDGRRAGGADPSRAAAHHLAGGGGGRAGDRREPRCRCCGGSRCSASAPATGPVASRSTSRPRAAGVTASASAASYRLRGRRTATARSRLTRADLRALPQRTAHAADRVRRGVERERHLDGPTVRDVLRPGRVRPPARRRASTSLQEPGPYRRTILPANFADDDRTLLALALDGEPLALDHGYPCRVIAPDRPGVLQTKWVARLEVPT